MHLVEFAIDGDANRDGQIAIDEAVILLVQVNGFCAQRQKDRPIERCACSAARMASRVAGIGRTHMKYIIEAFSWGTDLVAPDIDRCQEGNLEDARIVMNKQWENTKCFHVRIISQPVPSKNFKYNLYCMRSRPTRDRELHRFFEKVVVPDGVETIRRSDRIDVLRVIDFPTEIPVSSLHLPADEFYYDFTDTGMQVIKPHKSPVGNKIVQLNNFETCLAVAAFKPSGIVALLDVKDNLWYFLNEVDVKQGQAKLSFSWMEAGTDFVQ